MTDELATRDEPSPAIQADGSDNSDAPSASTADPVNAADPVRASGEAISESRELRGGPATEPPAAEETEAPTEPRAEGSPDPRARGRRRLLVAFAWVLAATSFLVPIAWSGIWDPHELTVADLARRIAVALMGAADLAIEGGVNEVPTTGELGRGELPFSAIALGFRLFGLYDWAGRLPLALFALLGCGATYLMLSRLVDRVAASFSVIVLATTPLYFLHARTMLGDAVTMSTLAIAVAGLSLAAFDERAGVGARVGYWILAVVGIAAGVAARGVLVAVAIPGLSVGLAWLCSRRAPERRLVAISGAAALLIGLIGVGVGGYALATASEEHFSRLLGAQIAPPQKLPTHDFIVLHLGHALFPWSAVVPFAMGRILRPDPPDASDQQQVAATRARLVCAIAAVMGLGVYGLLAEEVGLIAFGPVFALAGIVGLAARDLEKGAPGSRAMAIGVAAFAILFYTDFKNFPEKGLSPFAVAGASFPDSFEETATRIIKYGTVAMAALFLAATMDDAGNKRPVVDKRDYRAWLVAFRESYRGNLQFVAIVVQVCLVVLAIAKFASDLRFHYPPLEKLSGLSSVAAKYGWIAFPLLVVSPWLVTFVRDMARAVLDRVPVTRATVAVASVAAFGATLSFWYYPALAAQISPKGVFSSYRSLSESSEPLAMLGQSAGSASYYAGRQVKTFKVVNQAFDWLVASNDARRWLVARSQDMPALNASYRGRFGKNIPVLDGRSSEILLLSNRLEADEEQENPFSKWVRDERPTPQHRLNVNFGGQLEALGWAITNLDGEPVEFVTAGKPYQVRLYYEVLRPVVGEWKTFIHIDGYQRRYNGDHATLEGKYPMRYWKKGDFIVDIHQIELEPNFTAGRYELFFGFFTGSRRLEVKRGPHKDDRVRAGAVQVR